MKRELAVLLIGAFLMTWGGLACFETEPEVGGDCEIAWEETCLDGTILSCTKGVWEESRQCKLEESCVVHTVTDSNDETNNHGYCVGEFGVGDYCELQKWDKKCVGNEILSCEGTGASKTWHHNGQCKTSESCVQREYSDEYGATSLHTYCVDEYGAGDYCDAQKWDEKCVGNIILECEGSGSGKTWHHEEECKTGQMCNVSTETDDYGNTSQQATCE